MLVYLGNEHLCSDSYNVKPHANYCRDERYSFCPHGTESLDVEPTTLCFTHSAPAVLVSIFWGTVGMVLPQGLCTFSFLCLGYSSTGCLWGLLLTFLQFSAQM